MLLRQGQKACRHARSGRTVQHKLSRLVWEIVPSLRQKGPRAGLARYFGNHFVAGSGAWTLTTPKISTMVIIGIDARLC